jgi:hypothetical protein
LQIARQDENLSDFEIATSKLGKPSPGFTKGSQALEDFQPAAQYLKADVLDILLPRDAV